MITNKIPTDWKQLQNAVGDILKQCGFKVEIEKKVRTARGEVEVDVYAEEFINGRKYCVICECKYWKANIPQTVIHSFRSVVNDIGANIGYIISLNGYQNGSTKASEFTNIELQTWENFQKLFFVSWFEKYCSPMIADRLDPFLTYTEPIPPKWYNKMTDNDKDEFDKLKNKYDIMGYIVMSFTPYTRMIEYKPPPKLPLNKLLNTTDSILINYIPKTILNAYTYKEFMEALFDYCLFATEEFRVFRNRYNNEPPYHE